VMIKTISRGIEYYLMLLYYIDVIYSDFEQLLDVL